MKLFIPTLLALLTASVSATGGKVQVMEAPGFQPHVTADAEGTIHIVYFESNGKVKRPIWKVRGNLLYRHWKKGATAWSEPVRINSDEDTATRISYPKVAIGEGGRIHIVWVTMQDRGMWHTRSVPEKTGQDGGVRFEKEQNLLATTARGIENGPAIAVDGDGNVFVVWHEGKFRDEPNRKVIVRHSGNGGKSFGPARRANPKGSGVCACCGLDAVVGPDGTLHIAFRAARKVGEKKYHRDMLLLESTNEGRTFSHRLVDEWLFQRCPTELTSLSSHPKGGAVLAWGTEGVVYFGDLAGEKDPVPGTKGPGDSQRMPAVAVNGDGTVLLAWNEMSKGRRTLAWQVYDADGKPDGPAQQGRAKGEEPARGRGAPGWWLCRCVLEALASWRTRWRPLSFLGALS